MPRGGSGDFVSAWGLLADRLLRVHDHQFEYNSNSTKAAAEEIVADFVDEFVEVPAQKQA